MFSRRSHWSVPLLVAAGLVLAQGCAPLAPPPRIRMREVKFALRDFNLPNGLRIVVEEDHSAPVVGVVAVVGSGASSDPGGNEGLAHLVEHLTFRARPDGRTSLWSLLAYAGAGEVNAVTGLDDTVFYAFGPSNALEALVKLEGLRLTQPLEGMDEATFEVEREVVRNELRSRTEHGDLSAAFSALQQALYPAGHPYARPLDGDEKTLGTLSLEAARQFAASHYVPGNITLLITGDVDGAHLDRLLNAALPGSLAAGAAGPLPARLAAVAPEPPAPLPGGLRQVTARVPFPELLIGWSVPRGFDDASALQDFVVGALEEELGHARRDRDILGVTTALIPGAEGSIIVARVTLREGKSPQAAGETVLDQVFRVWQPFNTLGDVPGATNSFNRLRSAAIVQRALDSERLDYRALTRAETTHFTRDPNTFSRSMRALSRVEFAQVGAFAFKYLSRERARMVYVAPVGAGEVRSMRTGVAAEAPETPAPVAFPASSLRSAMSSPGFGGFQSATLANGLEVIVGQRHAMPVVTLTLALPGGEALCVEPGAATLAGYLGNQSAHVQGAPGDFGASLRSRRGRDTVWLEERAASGNVENALAVLRDRVTSMRLSEGMLPYFREVFEPVIATRQDQPEARAERALLAALYGTTPYGRDPTVAELDQVKEAEIQRALDETYAPNHAVLAIVGDVEPEETVLQVGHWLGDWAAGSERPQRLTPPVRQTADATRIRIEPLAGASQVQLTFGCALPAAGAKQALASEVMARVLEHELEVRARHQEGATYGVQAQLDSQRGGAAMLRVSTGVAASQLGTVLREFHAQWTSLQDQGPAPEVLARGRWDHARTFNVERVTTGQLARRIASLRIEGRSLASEDVIPQLLTTVSAADVRQQARECQADSAMVLVGDPAAIQAALEAGGFGRQ